MGSCTWSSVTRTAGLLVLAGASGVLGQAQSSAPAKNKVVLPSTVPPEQIPTLIEQLCSRDFEAREAADAQLRKAGIGAVEALSEAFREHDDLETRVRIQQIGEFLYFWEKILGKNGFLGISHRDAAMFPGQAPRDPRLHGDHALFFIQRVIENTAAAKAGLREGDLIISVDGKTVPAGPDYAKNAQNFAELIRTKPPGSKLVFEVWRGERIEKLPIEIGYRLPEYYDNNAAPEDVQKEYQAAKSEFPQWWETNFGPWSPVEHDGSWSYPTDILFVPDSVQEPQP